MSQTIVVGGIASSIFSHQTFNEAGGPKRADLLKVHPFCRSKQPVHGVFQRDAHSSDKDLPWMGLATDCFPGMIEAIENQLSGIDECAVQIKEDGFAFMDRRKDHVVVVAEESYLIQFTIRIGKGLDLES